MAAAASGVFVWTLVEYLLHRFAFHRFAGLTRSSHPNHHAASRDLQYLFAPPAVVAGISLPLTVVLSLLLGSAAALKFMGGLLAGYLYYEAVHYRIHFANSEGWLIRRQRKAHFRHHFHDATQDFGVTTPLWDWVFGTSNPRPAAR